MYRVLPSTVRSIYEPGVELQRGHIELRLFLLSSTDEEYERRWRSASTMINMPRDRGARVGSQLTGSAACLPRFTAEMVLRWCGIFSSPASRVPSGSAELPAVGNTSVSGICMAPNLHPRLDVMGGRQCDVRPRRETHLQYMPNASNAGLILGCCCADAGTNSWQQRTRQQQNKSCSHMASGRYLGMLQYTPEKHIDWCGYDRFEAFFSRHARWVAFDCYYLPGNCITPGP
ncbi:hypothetical protein V8C44DRAFT_296409 [Trichoderma aethiopicum]